MGGLKWKPCYKKSRALASAEVPRLVSRVLTFYFFNETTPYFQLSLKCLLEKCIQFCIWLLPPIKKCIKIQFRKAILSQRGSSAVSFHFDLSRKVWGGARDVRMGISSFCLALAHFQTANISVLPFQNKSNTLSDVHLSFMAQYSKPRVGSLVARSRMVDCILASFFVEKKTFFL